MEPLRVPERIALILGDGTVVVGSPIIGRIIIGDPVAQGKRPEFDWYLDQDRLFGAPRRFRLDENGRLFTSRGVDGDVKEWQIHMAFISAWPQRDPSREVEVTAYFKPVPAALPSATPATPASAPAPTLGDIRIPLATEADRVGVTAVAPPPVE